MVLNGRCPRAWRQFLLWIPAWAGVELSRDFTLALPVVMTSKMLPETKLGTGLKKGEEWGLLWIRLNSMLGMMVSSHSPSAWSLLIKNWGAERSRKAGHCSKRKSQNHGNKVSPWAIRWAGGEEGQPVWAGNFCWDSREKKKTVLCLIKEESPSFTGWDRQHYQRGWEVWGSSLLLSSIVRPVMGWVLSPMSWKTEMGSSVFPQSSGGNG